MDIKYPDYKNGLVNLSCSILKHYGAEYTHSTLEILDLLLQKSYKNVVVILSDGLGCDALEHHLPESSILRRHLLATISSVFPPTTTAATTSLESGLTPVEHGWLGWSLYFSEIDKIVDAFVNTIKDSDESAANYHVAGRFIPYKSIYDKINETGNAKAYSVSPFGTNQVFSLVEMFDEVKCLCNMDGRKFIYAYWEEPDSAMHRYGCYSCQAMHVIEEFNQMTERLCSSLRDTLIIVTADHGHINLSYKVVSDYPELMEMLVRPTAIESRAACFYVKEKYRDRFADTFYKTIGDGFLLLSKQAVIDKKLFGDGNEHPKFRNFIGDFIAVAIADKGIVYSHKSKQFKSNHAGMTAQEMMAPLIVVET